MPRRNTGRKQDYSYEALRKAVKNYNAKVKRLLAKSPELAPHKLSYAEIKKNIRGISDLKTEINEIRAFNKKGGEQSTIDFVTTKTKTDKKTGKTVTVKEVTKVSEWAYNRAMRKMDIINENRRKINADLRDQYAETTVSYAGGVPITTTGEVPYRVKEEMDKLRPMDLRRKNKYLSKFDMEYLESRYGKDVYMAKNRHIQYKENYLEAIKTTFYGRIPQKMYREILNMVKSFSAEQIRNMYLTKQVSDDLFNIDFLYIEPQDIILKAQSLLEELQDVKST